MHFSDCRLEICLSFFIHLSSFFVFLVLASLFHRCFLLLSLSPSSSFVFLCSPASHHFFDLFCFLPVLVCRLSIFSHVLSFTAIYPFIFHSLSYLSSSFMNVLPLFSYFCIVFSDLFLFFYLQLVFLLLFFKELFKTSGTFLYLFLSTG